MVMKKAPFNTFMAVCCLALSGCATTINPDDEIFHEDFILETLPEPERVGVYHKVGKGQTLWRIARAYDVAVGDLVRANNIPDVAEIEVNQLILIPGAREVRSVAAPGEDGGSKEFVWPLKGRVISYFNQPDRGRVVKGIYIEAGPGETVRASRGGRVVFADVLAGYGEALVIDHEDGYYSLYARNAVLLVKPGDLVSQRQPVANVGIMDGRSFLHFQIHRNAREENPLFYLK
jgi:murein DD-endopeptidase MepM/ murein hydrolase activator NlpD